MAEKEYHTADELSAMPYIKDQFDAASMERYLKCFSYYAIKSLAGKLGTGYSGVKVREILINALQCIFTISKICPNTLVFIIIFIDL